MSKPEKKVPSSEEIEAIAEFQSGESECDVLCRDLLRTVEQLEEATGPRRRILLARLRAINARRQQLHCHPCLFE